MDQLSQISRQHTNFSKVSAAVIYALCVSIALNFFWEPGHIYASGVTGFAQIIQSLSHNLLPTNVMYFALNIPLVILGWLKIGHKFTLYTILAVVFSSIMMKVMPPISTQFDPIICALFGGVVNGVGTGFALKSGISTGGLDIIGIIVRKKTGHSFGTINIFFNLIIVSVAGFIFGWAFAFYTAIGIFVNGRVIDMIYTQNQKMQVMIVTEHPRDLIDDIQQKMRRGITIVHDVEGAFGHTEKTILFTIISRYEMYELVHVIQNKDPYAFVSITKAEKVIGRFKEPKVD